MNSWRGSTKAQYYVYIKQWQKFIKRQKPTINLGLQFLQILFSKNYSYHQISMARSAISLIIDTGNNETFGKQNIVKRYMKGIFELRPTLPRYQFTWNIQTLFNYFRRLPHQKDLPFKLLGKKLAILIALLAGGQRCQTIHAIDVLRIKVLFDKCIIPIYEKLKQTTKRRHLSPIEFRVYLREEKLCVVDNLKWYLKKTFKLRRHSKLFLATIKPNGPVSRDTISRWCRSMMKSAGIDTTQYSSHSTRSAASSYAKQKGVPLGKIIGAGGWSRESTFAQYYDKEIEVNQTIGEELLSF